MHFLIDHPKTKVALRIVFVAPEAIRDAQLEVDTIDWVAESEARLKWVNTALKTMEDKFEGRLTSKVVTISSISQWHGILIERRHLFMGRMTWVDGSDRDQVSPSLLTCGEAGYRYY